MDVQSEFLHDRARRPIFIDVPSRRPNKLPGRSACEPGRVLYGTRDAPRYIARLCPSKDETFFSSDKVGEMTPHVDDSFVVADHGIADIF